MVRTERRSTIEVVTLDRPERRNALDHDTVLELLEVQERLAAEPAERLRAIVLTGAPPAFCAGADLTGVEEGRFATDLSRVLRGFGALPCPVIAAIDGPALGAGTQLAVACDLRVATPGSVLGIPAAKLGLAVDHWTLRRASAELSPPIARAMLVAARTYTAAELERTGGIHLLGDLGAALDWAERIARLAPLTMAAHKVGLVASDPEGVEAFEELRSAAWASQDAVEGRSAFLDKRPATFTGR
ncbi:enoyl-CoA hydratase-related protein [Ilumatobacter sp.]|uniref:enoyl-CoA hydratase-related protein n=1 Tax=Ilumatobacter sp. TaxID=1967498 RepID=UPI003B52F944